MVLHKFTYSCIHLVLIIGNIPIILQYSVQKQSPRPPFIHSNLIYLPILSSTENQVATHDHTAWMKKNAWTKKCSYFSENLQDGCPSYQPIDSIKAQKSFIYCQKLWLYIKYNFSNFVTAVYALKRARWFCFLAE